MAFHSDHVHGVLQCADDSGKVFPGGFFGAGEIENEAAATGAGYGSGKHGAGGNFKALHPHGHRNGPNFAVQDGQGGFGGDIPRGKPSAAGGDDEIDVTPIGRSGELGLDLGDLIRDNGGVGNGKTGFLQHGADGGAAGIHPLAAAAQIADGDNCCCICHNYVLLFF